MSPPHGSQEDPGAQPGPLADSARVEAFSDGVFAIAITLLVLDLKAPASRGAVLHGLLAQWPAYLAYLASFGYIGVIWVNHHNLFTRIARVSGGLLWRNLGLLLATSVLPFPAAVVGAAFQYPSLAGQRTAIVFYALVGAASAATWLLLFHYLSRTPALLKDQGYTAFFAGERRRAVFGVALYALSALAAVWYPAAGLAIACVLPVFYGLTSTGWRSSGSGLPPAPVPADGPLPAAAPPGPARPGIIRRCLCGQDRPCLRRAE